MRRGTKVILSCPVSGPVPVSRRRLIAAGAGVLAASLSSRAARADQAMLRIARTATMAHLPIMVMERERLLEKHAAAAGIAGLQTAFLSFGGPAAQIDAMLSGNVDIACLGSAGLLTLWSKTKGTPSESRGIAALGSMPMGLNTRNPKVRSITDLTEADRIAVPSIKVSFNAMLLQMAAAKQWGMASYARLDALTVGLGQMDAVTAILSGRSEINADFTTPPFLQIEQNNPAVHTVITLKEILGEKGTITSAASTSRFHAANPGLVAVFHAALAEAMTLITNDKERAIDAYVAATGDRTTSRAVLSRALNDPDVEFTTVPRAMMTYARFMQETGIIKRAPGSLADLYFVAPSGGS